ncbi:MAG: dTMP kinase, partial [Pseudomonadota bacterium]
MPMSLLSIAPRLITLEGGEGVGKTSAIKVLREELERAGNEVITTREPGGTPLGEMLRGIICGSLIDHEISPQAELLMVFAARAQHLAEVITPALQRGAVVLCDRF